MLVKFCKQRDITNALDISENGVMFEKSERQMITVAVIIMILRELYDH
jgi:hypothetical protein